MRRPLRRPGSRRDLPRRPALPARLSRRPRPPRRRGPPVPLDVYGGPGEPSRAGRPDRRVATALGQRRLDPPRRPRPDRRGRVTGPRRAAVPEGPPRSRGPAARRELAGQADRLGGRSRRPTPRPGFETRHASPPTTRSGSPARACPPSSSAIGRARGFAGSRGSGSAGEGPASPIEGAWDRGRSPDRESARIGLLGDFLAASYRLVGLFGVDFILSDGQPWPVEINPRYTASVEVLELALRRSLLAEHRRACEAENAIDPSPPGRGCPKGG